VARNRAFKDTSNDCVADRQRNKAASGFRVVGGERWLRGRQPRSAQQGATLVRRPSACTLVAGSKGARTPRSRQRSSEMRSCVAPTSFASGRTRSAPPVSESEQAEALIFTHKAERGHVALPSTAFGSVDGLCADRRPPGLLRRRSDCVVRVEHPDSITRRCASISGREAPRSVLAPPNPQFAMQARRPAVRAALHSRTTGCRAAPCATTPASCRANQSRIKPRRMWVKLRALACSTWFVEAV